MAASSFCLVMETSMIYGLLQVSPIWRVIKFDYTYDDVSALIAKELYWFPLLVKRHVLHFEIVIVRWYICHNTYDIINSYELKQEKLREKL